MKNDDLEFYKSIFAYSEDQRSYMRFFMDGEPLTSEEAEQEFL